MKPAIVRCPTCGRRKKRSSNANRYYWELVSMVAEELHPQGQTFSKDAWHEYFKQRYIGADEVKLPNGKVMTVSHSTADLDTDDFAKYLDKVSQWAAQHGVYLELDA